MALICESWVGLKYMDLVRRMGGCDGESVSVKSPADVFMHFLADQKIYVLREGGERSLTMCSDKAGRV